MDKSCGDPIYSPEASDNFDSILRRIGAEAPLNARRFVGELQAQCERVASLPGTIGTPRPDVEPEGMRTTTHKGYVIVFRYTEDALEVLSVADGRADVADGRADWINRKGQEDTADRPPHAHSDLYASNWGGTPSPDPAPGAEPAQVPKPAGPVPEVD